MYFMVSPQGGENEGNASAQEGKTEAEEHEGHAGAGDAAVVGIAPVRVAIADRGSQHGGFLFAFGRDGGVE
jgi:hypothetical protein